MNSIEYVKELAEKYIPNSINGIELTTVVSVRKMLIPKKSELTLDIVAVTTEFEGSVMRCRFPQPVDEKFFKEESERIVKQLLCIYIKNLINYTEEK